MMTSSVLKKRPKRLPYRENVVGFIVNREGRILLQKRARSRDHWQFPQGGLNPGESKRTAILREIREELGLTKLKTLGMVEHFHTYDWPKAPQYAKEDFRGQRQTLFFLLYEGENNDVSLDFREATAWQWVEPKELVKTIARVRRPMAKRALLYYQEYIRGDR